MICNICGAELDAPLYAANDSKSLTSLCEIHPAPTTVWFCAECTHLSSRALSDNDSYYETTYKISLNTEDEDQIYEKNGDKIIYRTQYQADVLLGKLDLPPGSRIIDYGCAKSATMNHVLASRPDLDLHLFDVSEMYIPYWDRIVPADHRATFEIPIAWRGTMDAVTSFFVLEHIPQPGDALKEMASLLNSNGVLYGIVPDTLSNPADFIVVDHVNHFTVPSLHLALKRAGFSGIEIDTKAHRGAMIFTARKTGSETTLQSVKTVTRAIKELAAYWNDASNVISNAESENGKAAIYGSGFYGAYIFSRLRKPELIECFLDQSPFLQGREMFGKKIINPEDMPDDIDLVYVGLNPMIARDIISTMPWLSKRGRRLVFLDREKS